MKTFLTVLPTPTYLKLFVWGFILSTATACLRVPSSPQPGGLIEKTYIDFGALKTISSGTTSGSHNTVSSYAAYPSWYCFDNTRSECAGGPVGASADPVAIKALQFFYKKQTGDTLTIHGGWFKTAMPRVDPLSGEFSYIDPQVRVYENGAFRKKLVTTLPTDKCNPRDAESVGFMPGLPGYPERILSAVETYSDGLVGGVFLADGSISGYTRLDVYLHAGRVWYSRLKTQERNSANDPFSFYMLPRLTSVGSVDLENYAARSDFGQYPEDADIDTSAAASPLPRIGLNENDEELLNQNFPDNHWYNHVIVGFCLKATRHDVFLDPKYVDRAALFGMKVVTFSPEVKQR